MRYNIEVMALTQRGTAMKVKELTVEQLKKLIEETVEEKFEEMLGDPDEGLELTEETKKRLRESLSQMKRGEVIPVEQVAKELGLEWQ